METLGMLRYILVNAFLHSPCNFFELKRVCKFVNTHLVESLNHGCCVTHLLISRHNLFPWHVNPQLLKKLVRSFGVNCDVTVAWHFILHWCKQWPSLSGQKMRERIYRSIPSVSSSFIGRDSWQKVSSYLPTQSDEWWHYPIGQLHWRIQSQTKESKKSRTVSIKIRRNADEQPFTNMSAEATNVKTFIWWLHI